MSLHRYAAKRDVNEPEIIEALRKLPRCSVQQLSGKGVPDLLISYRNVLFLMEVKLPLSKRGGDSHSVLTADQEAWHREWLGEVHIVRSIEDAFKVLGIK